MKRLAYLFVLIGLCICACKSGVNTDRKLVNSYICYNFDYDVETRKTHLTYIKNGELKEMYVYINEWVLREWYEHMLLEYSGNYYVLMYGVKA